MVADFRDQFAQVLKERDVMRNRVAIRQNPVGIVKVEMNQAGHVIPAAKIQSDDVIAQMVGEFLHLESHWMRFHQRHALDVVVCQAARSRHGLKQIAPPQGFFGGLGFRNVDAERMLQFRGIDAVENPGHIEQGSRNQFSGDQARLAQVQSTRAGKDHRLAGLNGHRLVALLVVIA